MWRDSVTRFGQIITWTTSLMRKILILGCDPQLYLMLTLKEKLSVSLVL